MAQRLQRLTGVAAALRQRSAWKQHETLGFQFFHSARGNESSGKGAASASQSGPSSAVAAAKLPLAWALGGPLASVPSRHNSDSAAPLSSFTQAQPRSGNATAARSTADALGKLLNRVGWMPASVPAREGKEAQRPAVPSPPPELPGCRFHALPPGLLAAGGRSALGAAPADAAHGNALHAMSQQPLQHPRQALLPGGQARSFQTSVGPFGGGGGFNFPLTPTNVLILANVAIFALQLYGGLGIMGSFAQYNWLVAAGQYHRLLTSTFLHGGWLHLGANQFALHSLGPAVESICGYSAPRYLALYATCGFTGGLLSYLMNPISAVSVGSSGAIFGLLGAYVTHRWLQRDCAPIQEDEITWLVQVFGINFFLTYLANVDSWGHIGGMLGGAAFVMALGRGGGSRSW